VHCNPTQEDATMISEAMAVNFREKFRRYKAAERALDVDGPMSDEAIAEGVAEIKGETDTAAIAAQVEEMLDAREDLTAYAAELDLMRKLS
jgi:hypothetical protein